MFVLSFNVAPYFQLKKTSVFYLIRCRDAVDNVLREEQCGFRKGRGCVKSQD